MISVQLEFMLTTIISNILSACRDSFNFTAAKRKINRQNVIILSLHLFVYYIEAAHTTYYAAESNLRYEGGRRRRGGIMSSIMHHLIMEKFLSNRKGESRQRRGRGNQEPNSLMSVVLPLRARGTMPETCISGPKTCMSRCSSSPTALMFLRPSW